MLYRSGSYLITFGLQQFFREIRCSGAPLCEEGPLLVVANHPNFMLDSLIVNCVFKRDLWFLAKSTLFKGAFLKGFLERAHLIPVYRRQDNPADVGKNEETFAFATQKLSSGAGIVIFPEGVSLSERKLSPIKSGAARIALQTEAASNFRLGLKIQAVGLTYTELTSFRSAVTVTASEPLAISAYEQRYHDNAVETVRALTTDVEHALKEVTVEVSDVTHGQLLEKIGKLYESHTHLTDHRERYQRIANNLNRLGPAQDETRKELEGWIDFFFDVSSLFSLGGREQFEVNSQAGFQAHAIGLLRTIAVLIGVIVHFIPYRLVTYLVPRFSSQPVSLASCKFGLGLIVFPLWYIGLAILFLSCGMGWLLMLSSLFVCIVSGYFANRYFTELRVRALAYLWPGKKKPNAILKSMRENLIARLEQLRVD